MKTFEIILGVLFALVFGFIGLSVLIMLLDMMLTIWTGHHNLLSTFIQRSLGFL